MTALLMKMSASRPDKYIAVASQAAEDNCINQVVSAERMKYIDLYPIMNYDYTASDIPDKQPMRPNQHLYNASLPVVQLFINYTMLGYLAAGVTRAAV